MPRARTYRESAHVERPPAYQVYPGLAMSTESLRLLRNAELGMLERMDWYCWVNDSIPAAPDDMARALGLQLADVRKDLTPAVLTFFEPAEDDPTRLVRPALVRQMERLMQRRIAQAKGGEKGARARKEKNFRAISNPATTPRTLEQSQAEQSQTQLGKGAEQSTPLPQKNGGAADPLWPELEEAEARERQA